MGRANFNFRGVGWYFSFFQIFIEHSVSNSEGPDQTPHDAVSDLGLHCLPISLKMTLGLYVLS